jgi:gamma-glutamyltranspeptidase/glutathione hydrolase
MKKTYRHRGIVLSEKGMCAAAHPSITIAGINILKKGGNAMDAAIAMANVVGVVLPEMCGLGGDTFIQYYDAKTKKITAINGAGYTPKGATLKYYQELGEIPMDGIHAAAIPGAVAGYLKALEQFGTMPFSALIEDACQLAEEGFPITYKIHQHMVRKEELLKKYEVIGKHYLCNGTIIPTYGHIANPGYAKTLRLIGEKGHVGFYEGEIAKAIVHASKAEGGLFTLEDLSNFQAEVLEPVQVKYRNYKVFQCPPVSQGIIHLEEMGILNHFDMRAYHPYDARGIHVMVEAKKLAFSERAKYFGDPLFKENPVTDILSATHLQEMANKISLDTSLDVKDVLGHTDAHTSSMVVVDKDGNAVTLITSLCGLWGCGIEVENTGIILNNRAGYGFNTIDNHPNCIGPNKRTMSTLISFMVTDENDTLCWVGNTPGGDNQPQWNMQTLVNLIDYGYDVQTALEVPRWSDAQSSNIERFEENILSIEATVGEDVVAELRKLGHQVHVIEPLASSGAFQLIEIDGKVKKGGSDPRAEGCALSEI